MNAMILAAGLGTRLRPWTEKHPKALVEVGGVPMLERVMQRLAESGIRKMVVNVHHFPEQIVDFLDNSGVCGRLGAKVTVSDESLCLLETGGGIVRAWKSGLTEEGPLLVHNVDILSDLDIRGVEDAFMRGGVNVLLVVSDRDSGRKLLFDGDGKLRGWKNLQTGQLRPDGFEPADEDRMFAFSGIYVLDEVAIRDMFRIYGDSGFSITEYFLNQDRRASVGCHVVDKLNLMDIGKPETLREANLRVNLEK